MNFKKFAKYINDHFFSLKKKEEKKKEDCWYTWMIYILSLSLMKLLYLHAS